MQDRSVADQTVLAETAAKSFAVLCTTLTLLVAVAWHLTGGNSLWQWYAAFAISAAMLVIILAAHPAKAMVSTMVILTCTAAELAASAYSNNVLATKGIRFEALGYKLTAIAIAMLAPMPVWVGFAIVGFCGVAPVIQYAMLSPELRGVLSIQEPWMAVVYAVIALFLLRHRLHFVEVERTLSRLKVEQQALDNLARIFLGLRDLTNTPLQSIELTAKLLESKHVTPEEAAKQLERSLIRLRELSQALNAYEKDIDWTNTESSFDALRTLEKVRRDVTNR